MRVIGKQPVVETLKAPEREPAIVAPSRPIQRGPILLDLFTDPRPRGRVVGSRSPAPEGGAQGPLRAGIDAERVIAIDNGALRIQPLIRPGWGRSGVSYGPFRREPGLALAVRLINGHNLSRSYELRSFPRHVWRWIEATKCEPVPLRMANWLLFHHPRESIVRKLLGWLRASRRDPSHPKVTESLAVGWFADSAPTTPLARSNAFVVHGPESLDSGELWASVAGAGLPAFGRFQNVPVLYVVVLRERGAAYYVSSLPGAHGPGPYPSMRPVAVDPFADDEHLHAGVHQAVLGEVGFGIDTRVFGVKAERVAELSQWYGSAHAADALADGAPVAGAEADVGGLWRVMPASPGRGTMALLDPEAPPGPPGPAGLVHALIDTDAAAGGGLAWRAADAANAWLLTFHDRRCRLEVREQGNTTTVAEAEIPRARPGPASVQILDDGLAIVPTINGRRLFDAEVEDTRLADRLGVGIVLTGGPGAGAIRRFEAHPRQVPIPAQLDLGPFWAERGERTVVRDTFDGPPGDLEGRPTPVGGRTWERVFGPGRIDLTGDGAARVRADANSPCPGRTLYTLDWADPDFADISVELTPPGTGRFQKHHARAGMVFWQDRRNYILVCLWLDDSPLPASISTFFCLRGFEDVYDAVWTCIGSRRVHWGEPLRLRAAFDACNYLVHVNDEPVLSRAMTDVYPRYRPIRINRVGLSTTWEWGLDTGTTFRNFEARTR